MPLTPTIHVLRRGAVTTEPNVILISSCCNVPPDKSAKNHQVYIKMLQELMLYAQVAFTSRTYVSRKIRAAGRLMFLIAINRG